MSARRTMAKSEQESGTNCRSMLLTNAPNPRRTPPRTRTDRDAEQGNDGRKRQKLSHPLGKESQLPYALTKALDSQESSSSDQSASKWFKHANKNIGSSQRNPSELDNDPPFYMTNHPNYIPNGFAASQDGRRFGTQSRFDSENEDLRGVIDDLTVENKRLRQVIRMQHKQRRNAPIGDAAQQQDKLFEVRIHGLPTEKRRELEYMLKTFATSIHSTASAPSKSISNSYTSASAASNGQNAAALKSGAAQTDSGYASNTTSGTPLIHQSIPPVPAKSSTRQAVKSYLRDIPDTLLPRHNPIMSERAKQALVVRRLEQLFTGRQAGPGAHEQSVQQEEISQSAAQADRMQDGRINRKRKAEGRREAHVMAPDTRINLDAIDSIESKDSPLKPTGAGETIPYTRSGSPEQRPTRPLDLDIHRAQVADDNIKYIQHLGLTSDHTSGTLKDDEEGLWVYLNLLTGLAQLHTLHVTPEFVRRAITKRSKHFEVSKDGHKVRWVGGADGTVFAAEDEKAIESADIDQQESADDTGNGGSSSKRSKSNSISAAAAPSNTPSEDKTSGLQTCSDSKAHPLTTVGSGTSNLPTLSSFSKPTTGSAFDYKPIVYRERPREFDDLQGSDESFDSQSPDSNSLVHALNRSNLNQQAKDEGHITFYNNPYFCSDFSADLEPSNIKPPQPIIVGETLGVPFPESMKESPLRHHDATYFTTQFAPKPFDPDRLGDGDMAKFVASLPNLPDLLPLRSAGQLETMPLEFDVCGLGGVTPQENFAMDVTLEMRPTPSLDQGAVVKQLPFSRRRYLQKFQTLVKACDRIDLLPSRLPPPSYLFFTSSSSSDTSDICDDDMSESDQSSSHYADEENPGPPVFLHQFSGSSRGNNGDDEDDDMTSSDIDMLAMARKLNPQGIAEQERVYMITEPGGGQRAVAGSLAATVGASQSASSRMDGVVADSSVSENGSLRTNGDDNDDDDDDDEGVDDE